MQGKNVKNRMLHMDLLRIFAAFSVVMLHSAAQFWYDLDIYGGEWLIANSYDAMFRFGVPVFVMISGALFLAPEYKLDVKRLYTHNILRLVIIYLVWSSVYGLYDSFVVYGLGIQDVKPILREMISGRYHLWYLPMIVGIYVLLPILKSWIANATRQNLQYFIGLFIGLQIGVETIRALTVTDELHAILDWIRVDMVCGYLGYFVLGYYLAHVGIGESLRKVLYISVLPAVLLNVLLGNGLARRSGVPVGSIYDSFGVFTFLISVALFVFTVEKGSLYLRGKEAPENTACVDNRCKGIERWSGVIWEVSADTLGIYLMHVGLMEMTLEYGIHSMTLPNIVGIPLYAVGCFVVCLVATMVLRRIPFVGRYIC